MGLVLPANNFKFWIRHLDVPNQESVLKFFERVQLHFIFCTNNISLNDSSTCMNNDVIYASILWYWSTKAGLRPDVRCVWLLPANFVEQKRLSQVWMQVEELNRWPHISFPWEGGRPPP